MLVLFVHKSLILLQTSEMADCHTLTWFNPI